jgi:hypothetical protein
MLEISRIWVLQHRFWNARSDTHGFLVWIVPLVQSSMESSLQILQLPASGLVLAFLKFAQNNQLTDERLGLPVTDRYIIRPNGRTLSACMQLCSSSLRSLTEPQVTTVLRATGN